MAVFLPNIIILTLILTWCTVSSRGIAWLNDKIMTRFITSWENWLISRVNKSIHILLDASVNFCWRDFTKSTFNVLSLAYHLRSSFVTKNKKTLHSQSQQALTWRLITAVQRKTTITSRFSVLHWMFLSYLNLFLSISESSSFFHTLSHEWHI